MATAALTRYTPEEYLALDRRAEFKSEYIDGRVVAMTGGTWNHSAIVSDLGGEIRNRLRGRPCVAHGNLRVRVGSQRYVYPDVQVVCGEPRMEDNVRDTLLNPTLIVEVLSPGTELYDRGEKFKHYPMIESLVEYVLVAADSIFVERYTKRGDLWTFTAFGPGETLVLESIGCEIPLETIYEHAQFEAGGASGT
jgi:Uma2 family endonuclease